MSSNAIQGEEKQAPEQEVGETKAPHEEVTQARHPPNKPFHNGGSRTE